MGAATQTTPGLISTISSWLSKEQEKPVAKVVFSGTKITESVFDLRPIGEQVEDFNVEIVFFHGLQRDPNNLEDAYFMTWVSTPTLLAGTEAPAAAPPHCWPATLLPKLFPKARLLSVKYDGAGKKASSTGRDDLESVMENLVVELILNNRPFGAGVGQTRAPVIFVTHCFGGLVAQKLILEVDEQLFNRTDDLKLKNFWNNWRGIVYYSPPFAGLDQSVKATSSVKTRGPLVKFMEVLFKQSSRILQDFTKLLDSERLQPKPPSLVLSASSDTMRGGFSEQVVQEGLSRLGDVFVTVDGDHFSVCQPEDETSQSFQHLGNFVQDVVGNYMIAAHRSRGAATSNGGDAGSSSPMEDQAEQSPKARGRSGSFSTTLHTMEHGRWQQKNKISLEHRTLSTVSAGALSGAEETADKAHIDSARSLPALSRATGSTELIFFKSYD